MTKAMNYCMGLSIALMTTHALSAQDYKTQVTNSKETQLVLSNFGGDLPVEGYAGSEIIISGGPDMSIPDRAKGLKPVFSGGSDNTGRGLFMEKSGNKITITCLLSFNKRGEYKIKVPDNIALKINSGCEYNTSVDVSNMKNEIDINICGDIKIKGSAGPLVLSNINGGIDVVFNEINKEKPSSIASINGEIDVTMPANTAVNLSMRNLQGGMYTDFELPTEDKELKRVGGGQVAAKLNGGGVKLSLSNINGNIYLRKK